MPNRYTRDELIIIALDQAMVPSLQIHECPNGVVQPDAFAIQWLQDIIDFWYHLVPFSATVKKVSLNCVANSDTILLPTDFIVDVRNGFVVQTVPGNLQSFRRRLRLPLQKFISYQLSYQSQGANVLFPNYYSINGDDNVVFTQRQTMLVTPTPTIATVGHLWYYALPLKLEANHFVKMPNDYACIEYVKIRAWEWIGKYNPGTAQQFCDKIVATMKSAGLMNEPEDDEMGFDELTYKRGGYDGTSYHWMGGA